MSLGSPQTRHDKKTLLFPHLLRKVVKETYHNIQFVCFVCHLGSVRHDQDTACLSKSVTQVFSSRM